MGYFWLLFLILNYIACGIGLGESVLKKKMNNVKILGKELIINCDDL